MMDGKGDSKINKTWEVRNQLEAAIVAAVRKGGTVRQIKDDAHARVNAILEPYVHPAPDLHVEVRGGQLEMVRAAWHVEIEQMFGDTPDTAVVPPGAILPQLDHYNKPNPG